MLFKALSVFALREIDLTKIESRPMRDNPLVLSGDGEEGGQRQFNYMFYIDFVGSLAEPHVQNALRHLEVREREGGGGLGLFFYMRFFEKFTLQSYATYLAH